MGCNTSKESVPQAESDNKENQENAGESTEEKNTENRNDGDGKNAEESNDTKSISAKTITLRSNGTAKSLEETEVIDLKSQTFETPKESGQTKEASKDQEKQSSDLNELKDEAEAATKIQAAFRGHKTRKSMKQPAASNAPQQTAESEPTREQLEQEFRLDDAELCHAATKIQASFRGHMTRKHETEAKQKESSSSKEGQKEKNNDEEELDIDLTDPDLNKAAVKIQASFRGHMVRKENEAEEAATTK